MAMAVAAAEVVVDADPDGENGGGEFPPESNCIKSGEPFVSAVPAAPPDEGSKGVTSSWAPVRGGVPTLLLILLPLSPCCGGVLL